MVASLFKRLRVAVDVLLSQMLHVLDISIDKHSGPSSPSSYNLEERRSLLALIVYLLKTEFVYD